MKKIIEKVCVEELKKFFESLMCADHGSVSLVYYLDSVLRNFKELSQIFQYHIQIENEKVYIHLREYKASQIEIVDLTKYLGKYQRKRKIEKIFGKG